MIKRRTFLQAGLTGGMAIALAYLLHPIESFRKLTKNPLPKNQPITNINISAISQLLWAAQGITSQEGFRTAPSAGALFPLELYAAVSNVEGLDSGLFKYSSSEHTLKTIRQGDFRQDIFEEALQQNHLKEAAVNIIITAIYERTTDTYGERGRRYVHMEVGHAGQNICLQAQSLNLGVCPIGAFEDDGLKHVLGLLEEEDPLYILSIGRLE